ncbi:cell division protein FtsL [Aquibaculum arenosum]|uniref:Cell division protein FtsL n=1 Tax=Aquibaculum arenosum TaxID=3032591 RepID=A0ABT5YSN2_9PROT|nr:hypothetical protein [Fodinicurvata sp. CAU 1616]MDF2097224.1 hypothetical protein [Fodinicurvata sp. CAU 1616]
MTRLLLILIVAAAAGVAGLLFQVKYEVQEVEKELAEINRQILEDREATHVLKAEWSYLNQPARIAALAERHLELGPMRPQQVVQVRHLPPRPEDFGYSQTELADAEPLPRERPLMPAGWQPEALPSPQRTPARTEGSIAVAQVDASDTQPAQAPEPQASSNPTPAAAPADPIADTIARLGTDAVPPLSENESFNPLTGRPLPVSTGGGGVR